MKNEILAFRRLLSEKGIEMTPYQAKSAYKASKSIVRTSRKMSMIDIWNLEDEEGFCAEEKKSLVEIYKGAKEL